MMDKKEVDAKYVILYIYKKFLSCFCRYAVFILHLFFEKCRVIFKKPADNIVLCDYINNLRMAEGLMLRMTQLLKIS